MPLGGRRGILAPVRQAHRKETAGPVQIASFIAVRGLTHALAPLAPRAAGALHVAARAAATHPPPRPSWAAIAVALILPALLAGLLTPLVRRLARRWGVVRSPRERDVHRGPMPLLGGLPICGAVLLSLPVLPL